MSTTTATAPPDRCEAAVDSLMSDLHQSKTPEALKNAAARRTHTVNDMRTYMKRMKLEVPSHINVVHVAGTKGKGSTCVMCEAILRERYGLNTGLFTSPHLVDIRERIRINGKPVSKKVFAEAYFEIRKRLEEEASKDSEDDLLLPVLPGYFRMLTLMAMFIFVKYDPAIDVIILEVGMGGRYDATNILDLDSTRNVVCGVTLLDYDHVRVLGSLIEQIAWEKGGIFQEKKGMNLTTRPTEEDRRSHAVKDLQLGQLELDDSKLRKNEFFALGTNVESSVAVLRACAMFEGMRQLHLVHEGQALPPDAIVGLNGPHQRINAELAIALCDALVTMGEGVADSDKEGTCRALAKVSWPGRCQTVKIHWPVDADDGTPLHLCLDGAHTTISLQVGVTWFQTQCSPGDKPILVFNCSHERDPVELLKLLLKVRPRFSAVYFCRADFERPSMVGKGTARELLLNSGFTAEQVAKVKEDSTSWQETLAEVWRFLDDAAVDFITSGKTVRGALMEICRNATRDEIGKSREQKIFVTGSLYIVGSALDAVGWTETEATGTLRL